MAEEEIDAPTERQSRSRLMLSGIADHARDINAILSPLGKAVIFVTLILGGYQYLYTQHEARVARSLAYISDWNSKGYRQSFGELNALIWPIYAKNAAAIEALAASSDLRDSMLANIGERITGADTDFANTTDQQVDDIFDFFNRAAICANERICDFEVINTFLGPEARSFWQYFSRYAKRRASLGYAGYGDWTERFARGEINGRPFGWF